MSSPGYDHLGLLQDGREEVDRLLAECERYADKDDRVQIVRYEDLEYPGLTVHAATSGICSPSISTCSAWSASRHRPVIFEPRLAALEGGITQRRAGGVIQPPAIADRKLTRTGTSAIPPTVESSVGPPVTGRAPQIWIVPSG